MRRRCALREHRGQTCTNTIGHDFDSAGSDNHQTNYLYLIFRQVGLLVLTFTARANTVA